MWLDPKENERNTVLQPGCSHGGLPHFDWEGRGSLLPDHPRNRAPL